MFECIWRRDCNSIPSEEHIIPEALGCPPEFVLKDGAVCERHNNKLGQQLDKAVVHELDLFAFRSKVPGKKGKNPQINSRGNMVGFWQGRKPVLFINMDRKPVVSEFGPIGKSGGSKRNVEAKVERVGNVADVSFSIQLGNAPKFARGLAKIAFSSLAFFHGPETVLSDKFDPIREFVLDGKGERKIAMFGASDYEYKNEVTPPVQNAAGDYAIHFRLACIEFIVDLSPGMVLFPVFKEKLNDMYGSNVWRELPL
jgi:hypothetical protein